MNYNKEKPVIRLLESADKEYFLDCVDEFYTTIEEISENQIIRKIQQSGRLKSWLIRKMISLPFFYTMKIRIGNDHTINFASMISGDFRLMVPHAFNSSRNFIYMYDVWPRFHHWIFPMLDFFNITWVFFSSKQVYLDYTSKYPLNKCKAMWLPEAVKLNEYSFKPAMERSTDVLEFGRNYDLYHDLITEPLRINHKKHIFKTKDQPVLFPAKSDFTTALANSKIVICVPSDISHPERAEYISTMTLRYLQAMASKCLIVGMLPSDMVEAFGYNPIVEIDMEDAAAQLLEVLNNYNAYLPLIEKNYDAVKANHQWINRWQVIRVKMEDKDE